MEKQTMPAALLMPNANYTIIRPELNFRAMKDALGKIMKAYNAHVDALNDAMKNEEGLQKLAVSMEATAKQILFMFCQKFAQEQTTFRKMKFTRGYFTESYGVDFRAPALPTLDRHFLRFLKMPNSFLKAKDRSTLHLPDRNTVCIELELVPEIIVFKNEVHNVAHRNGDDVRPREKQGWRGRTADNRRREEFARDEAILRGESPLDLDIVMPVLEKMEELAQNRQKQSAKGLGDIAAQIFQNGDFDF